MPKSCRRQSCVSPIALKDVTLVHALFGGREIDLGRHVALLVGF